MNSGSIFFSCMCCSHMIPNAFVVYLTGWVPTQQYFHLCSWIMFFTKTPSFPLSASKSILNDICATLLVVTFSARKLYVV